MATLDRIKSLCKKKRINITTLEKECDLSQNSIVKWAKTSPSTDKIVSVAKYFNVSADYLLCLIDEPKPLESREIAQKSETALALFEKMPSLFEEQRFIDTAKIYSELPDEKREGLYGMAVGIAVGLGLNIEKILRR